MPVLWKGLCPKRNPKQCGITEPFCPLSSVDWCSGSASSVSSCSSFALVWKHSSSSPLLFILLVSYRLAPEFIQVPYLKTLYSTIYFILFFHHVHNLFYHVFAWLCATPGHNFLQKKCIVSRPFLKRWWHGIFSAAILPDLYGFPSVGILCHSVDVSLRRVHWVLRPKGTYDASDLEADLEALCLGAGR